MKEYIATKGPLAVAIHTHDSFKAYKGGAS